MPTENLVSWGWRYVAPLDPNCGDAVGDCGRRDAEKVNGESATAYEKGEHRVVGAMMGRLGSAC
jgi:hypothetical protein